MKSSLPWLNVVGLDLTDGDVDKCGEWVGSQYFVSSRVTLCSIKWIGSSRPCRTHECLSAPLCCRARHLSAASSPNYPTQHSCFSLQTESVYSISEIIYILFFLNLPLCVMSCLIRQVSQAFGKVRWKIRVYMMGLEGVRRKCKQVVCKGFEGGGALAESKWVKHVFDRRYFKLQS